MANEFDIIVVGAGTMGLAASAYLALSGLKVLTLDQFSIPNDLASHSGYTRIIRKAYYEHPDYVPLLQRSYSLWRSLEETTQSKIYHETGILYMGDPTSSVLTGCKTSGALYDIPLIQVDLPSYQSAGYPFLLDNSWEHFVEPEAGYLDVHAAMKSFQQTAVDHGAIFKTNEKVLSWSRNGAHWTVETAKSTYTSNKIIFTAGSWTQALLSNYNMPLKVTRQVIAWIKVEDTKNFSTPSFPCWFIHDLDYGMFYGFPGCDDHIPGSPSGIKVALHVPGASTNPDQVNRQIMPEDKALMAYFLKRYLPQLQSCAIEYKTCLYSNTPDEHFILDYLPDSDEKIILACGFSGHGFKFAPVIGEILAQMAQGQKPELNCDFLGLSRFQQA